MSGESGGRRGEEERNIYPWRRVDRAQEREWLEAQWPRAISSAANEVHVGAPGMTSRVTRLICHWLLRRPHMFLRFLARRPRPRPLPLRPLLSPPHVLRKMATTHSHPRSESPTATLPQPPEKKPRLEDSLANPAQPSVFVQDAAPDADSPAAKPSAGNKPSKAKKNKKTARRVPDPFSHDDILTREVIALLGQDYADLLTSEKADWNAPFEQSTQLELTVSRISPSTGEHSLCQSH